MFNKNYLGHDLINVNPRLPNNYKCFNCNVCIFYSKGDNSFYIISGGEIKLKSGKYIITCTEQIIKNIIE